MNIIETLTMAEIEELTALTGTDFIEVLENGVKPGRPLASLAWILEKRTNSDAKIEPYLKMTMAQMREVITGYTPDPKA